MSHTSSGLHAAPSGWMNERAERLAGGGARWLKQLGLCQLPSVIKKVSMHWSQDTRRLMSSQRWLRDWRLWPGWVTAFKKEQFGNLELRPRKSAVPPRCRGPGRRAASLGSGDKQDCTCNLRNLPLVYRRKFICSSEKPADEFACSYWALMFLGRLDCGLILFTVSFRCS